MICHFALVLALLNSNVRKFKMFAAKIYLKIFSSRIRVTHFEIFNKLSKKKNANLTYHFGFLGDKSKYSFMRYVT